jgi:hypothetical protein
MAIQWNQVKPDFSGSSSSMKNAMTGISQAGTVFSKLRDDIIAEEQRAAEAAYKQQVFDENVRQFEAQQAYNEEQKRLDRLHDFELESKRHTNNKEITQLKIQADNAKENRAKNRHNQAVAIGRKAYAEAIANGASPLDALWASEQAVAAEGLADTNINYATTVVPTKDRTIVAGMATPEYRATQAAKNNIVAGDLALSAKGKETEYNEYTDIFSRLRSGDDGSQGIIDANTGELRPLTVEEQDYLNKVQNLQVADAMQAAPETIKALRQEATKRGLTIENAEQYGRRNLTGIGSEDIYREQALLHGADPSKVIPTDTANAANEERKNLAILEEVKRKVEADARTNSKTSSYNQSFSEFLDNFKIAGKDGKATIHGIDPETVAEVQTVQEQFMKFGIGNDQFKMYLKLKANDIRYNEAHMMSSSDQAEQFAQNLINDVPKTGAGNDGNNGNNGETKPKPGNGLVGLGNTSQENKPTPKAMRNIPEDTSKMDDTILADARQSIVNLRNSYTQMFKKDGSLVPGAIGFGGSEKALQRAEQLKTKEKNLTKVLDSLKANKPVDPSSEEAKTVKNMLLTMRDRYKNQRRATDENLQYLARIEQLLKLFEKGE